MLSVLNLGLLVTLVGLLILILAHTGVGLTLLVAGACVAIAGIITGK
jgi:hypothetical protein